MLGARPVDVFAWESFGEEWVTDAVEQLKLADCRIHVGRPYGVLPDLSLARDDGGHRLHAERHDLGREDPELRLDSRGSRRASPSMMRPAPRSRSRSSGRSAMW